MAEITYQMVLSTIQTVSLVLGIIYYLTIMRNNQKNQQMQLETRQAQLFMYMYDRWSGPEFMKSWYEIRLWKWTGYDDFMDKYGDKNNPDRYLAFSTVSKFFEGLGVLVKRGFVEPSLVDDLMSGFIIIFWEDFGESFIKDMRVNQNFPQAFEWVEYLYNTIKPITESQHPELQS